MSLEFRYEDSLLDTHVLRAQKERPLGHFMLSPFDELVGGIRSARFTALCAQPGMAKTTLFGQLADEAANVGFVNIVNTLEIPAHQWVAKSIARLSDGALALSDVSDPDKAELVYQFAELYRFAIASNMIFIETPLTPVELGAIVGRVRADRGPKVILWHDYLQIMPTPSEQPSSDERTAIKEAVSGLRRIANAHDIPVFAISSINRTNYDKTPGLSALGGSSSIEYSVDSVIYMSVEGKGNERETNMNVPIRPIVLTALKNRYAPKGTTKLTFDAAHATFAAHNP